MVLSSLWIAASGTETVVGWCVIGRVVPVQPGSTLWVTWEELLEDADALL